MGYKDSVLTDSPKVYLNFAGDSLTANLGSRSGVTVTDSTVASYAAGIADRAPVFGGPTTSGHVTYNVNPNNIFNGSTWAVEAWFKRNASQNDWSTVVFTSGGNSQIQISLTPASKVLFRYKTTAGAVVDTTSATSLTDTNWHHVVLTTNGTTVSAYLDGSLVGTNPHYAQTFGSTDPVRLGSYGASTGMENMYGSIDEVAMYDTFLSSTRVSAHYAARLSVDGGYTAQASTGTGAMVDPVVSFPKSNNYNATAMAGSGAATNPVVTVENFYPTTVTKNTNADTYVNSAAATTLYGNYASFNSGPTFISLIKFDVSNLPQTAKVSSIDLKVAKSGGGAITNTIAQQITSTWNESTVNWNNRPTTNLGFAATTVTGSGIITFSFTVPAGTTVADLVNGFALTSGTTNAAWYSKENATSQPVPQMVLTYLTGGTNVAPVAAPATASAVAVDPVVTAQTIIDKVATAAVATGSGVMTTPVVAVSNNPDAIVAGTVMTGDATMPGGNYASPTNVNVNVMVGVGEMKDGTVTTQKNGKVNAPALLSGQSVMPIPSLNVNGQDIVLGEGTSDGYYNLLYNSTDIDDMWFRLDETTGNTVHSVSGRNQAYGDKTIYGSYNWNVYGPQGRKSLHTDDAYIDVDIANAGAHQVFEFTFETVIRTTKANGMLAWGMDVNGITNAQYKNSLYLQNGKVTFQLGDGTAIGRKTAGIKRVDDGQWHHIVVAWGTGNRKALDNGFRIYIDGELDIRREYSSLVGQQQIAGPDTLFGVPSNLSNDIAVVAPNFIGDVMEVVFRSNSDIDQDYAQKEFYAVNGVTPIAVEPFGAIGYMPEVKAKGNQKRALMLYFEYTSPVNNAFGGATYTPLEEYSSGKNQFPGDFDFGPSIGTPRDIQFVQNVQLAGYKVFYQPVKGEDRGGAQDAGTGQYRDAVTDLPRLLNLQEDINVDQYDVIFFRNFPDEGRELDGLHNSGYTDKNLEDFVGSVRAAVDTGISLWVSSPTLAARLGIINKAEVISRMYEQKYRVFQGNALNDYDPRSAAIDPWGAPVSPGVPDYGDYFYRDVHSNIFQRVTAVVDGLTTLPAEIMTDGFIRDARDNLAVSGLYSYKTEKRDNGLHIGDTFMDLTAFVNYLDPTRLRANDWHYTWGVPAGGLNTGTAVTKFSGTVWTGGTETTNPYAEYIGSIVLEPGDPLKGRPVGGKIFVNLDEDPSMAALEHEWVTRQLVPDNSQIARPEDREDAAKRQWDYSSYRLLIGSAGGIITTTTQLVQQSDGSSVAVVSNKTSPGAPNIDEKYPREPIKVYTMTLRGLTWLGDREVVNAGDAVVRVPAMTGTASMVEPQAKGQRSIVVTVPAAIGTGIMKSPAEAHDPDIRIPVLPAYGSGEMTGYSKVIAVAPMTGSGMMPDSDDIYAGGENIVLYLLSNSVINLYIREDA